jgi:hypothetical protein
MEIQHERTANALREGYQMVRRLRRLRLRIEHREVSVSTINALASPGDSRTVESPVEPALPASCPSCGAPWHASLQQALSEAGIDSGRLQAAILDRRLHLQRQPDGGFRVCERSLQQIREGVE